MATKPVRKKTVAKKSASKKPVQIEKKPRDWPKCETVTAGVRCKNLSMVFRRNNGEEEHYCAEHWKVREKRNLKASGAIKVGLKKKAAKAKRKVVVKK